MLNCDATSPLHFCEYSTIETDKNEVGSGRKEPSVMVKRFNSKAQSSNIIAAIEPFKTQQPNVSHLSKRKVTQFWLSSADLFKSGNKLIRGKSNDWQTLLILEAEITILLQFQMQIT